MAEGYTPPDDGSSRNPTRRYTPSDVGPSRRYTPSDAGPRRSPTRRYTPSDAGSSRRYTPSDAGPSTSPTRRYTVRARRRSPGQGRSSSVSSLVDTLPVPDNVKLSQKIYEDLGDFETEVSIDGPLDLPLQKRYCRKNHGHSNFIPASEFTMNHLPPPYRKEELFAQVSGTIFLTAKVSVCYVSPGRWPGSPLFKRRGQSFLRTGSGWFTKVNDIHERDNIPCPCVQCKHQPPADTWSIAYLCTAKNLVFDTKEAQHTTAELFYDDENNTTGVKILHGLKVVDGYISGDWILIECVTHDTALAMTLSEVINDFHNLWYLCQNEEPLIIIISHPHGCSKLISLGTEVRRRVIRELADNIEWTMYQYKVPTCRGSSGAPVLILGPLGYEYKEHHVHSEKLYNGYNQSGEAIECRPEQF